jgi:hypothetical protein
MVGSRIQITSLKGVLCGWLDLIAVILTEVGSTTGTAMWDAYNDVDRFASKSNSPTAVVDNSSPTYRKVPDE